MTIMQPNPYMGAYSAQPPGISPLSSPFGGGGSSLLSNPAMADSFSGGSNQFSGALAGSSSSGMPSMGPMGGGGGIGGILQSIVGIIGALIPILGGMMGGSAGGSSLLGGGSPTDPSATDPSLLGGGSPTDSSA